MTARPERVAAEEVRQRMLDAGRDLALEAGAALTIEHLRMEEVIQRARVPRSSVYRMWAYREDYIDDLLCYLAGTGSVFRDRPVFDPGTVSVIGRVVADNRHLLATAGGRRSLLCEVVRLAATRNYTALTESAPWRLHMALMATLGSTRTGEARRQIAAALEDSQRRSRESMVVIFEQLAKTIGLRLRDPACTLNHMQLSGGLLIQSMALRNIQVRAARGAADGSGLDGSGRDSASQDGASQDGARPDGGRPGRADPDQGSDTAVVDNLLNAPIPGPGLDGRPAEWTLAAFAYLGVVDAFMELDPDFTPPPACSGHGGDASS